MYTCTSCNIYLYFGSVDSLLLFPFFNFSYFWSTLMCITQSYVLYYGHIIELLSTPVVPARPHASQIGKICISKCHTKSLGGFWIFDMENNLLHSTWNEKWFRTVLYHRGILSRANECVRCVKHSNGKKGLSFISRIGITMYQNIIGGRYCETNSKRNWMSVFLNLEFPVCMCICGVY